VKNKIIYISIFLAAFALTSAAIIYFNSKYANIFVFDFRPAETLSSAADTPNNTPKGLNESFYSTGSGIKDTSISVDTDSVKRAAFKKRTADSLYAAALNKFKDSTTAAGIPEKPILENTPPSAEQKPEIKLIKKDAAPVKPKTDVPLTETAEIKRSAGNDFKFISTNKEEIDSIYNKWMKSTAKLYENMEPKKAAKIISSYSDNMARDIIYTMKKKKAAEILAELSPEFASRITRMK